METGEEVGKHTLLARCLEVDGNKERSPPNRSCALNACGHHGGEGGGIPLTCQNVHQTCSRGMEEEEGPPTQKHA